MAEKVEYRLNDSGRAIGDGRANAETKEWQVS